MLSNWDQGNLAKFLQFLTGSSQVSVNGFNDFVDRRKPITIAPDGKKKDLFLHILGLKCSICLNMTQIEILFSVTKIGLHAFKGCSSLFFA